MKILSNYTDHNPNCESVKLHEELILYTDIILLGCIDHDEWDENLNQIKETLTEKEESQAHAMYDIKFMRLYIQSLKDNYYWEYCPFEVFKNTLPTAIKHYLRYSPDSLERDFYINELIEICDLDKGLDKKMKEPKFSFSEFYSHPKKVMVHGKSGAYGIQFSDTSFYDVIEATQRKKINYLIEQLVNEEFKENTQLLNEPQIDYSDNSLAEKITFLYELGILDFLQKSQPFNTSINKLASAISSFTGEKQGSIQPTLNSIFGKRVLQKNNPLPKNQDKVRKKLIELGCHIDVKK